MKSLKKIPAVFLIILLYSTAYSHPDHDHHEDNTLLHYTTSPYHYIPIFMVLFVVSWILIKKKSKNTSLRGK